VKIVITSVAQRRVIGKKLVDLGLRFWRPHGKGDIMFVVTPKHPKSVKLSQARQDYIQEALEEAGLEKVVFEAE